MTDDAEGPTGTEEQTRRIPVRSDDGDEPAMSWRVAAASWVGLLRHNNQDSAYTSSRLIGVADGMGGEAAGDLASMVAARRFWLADEQPSATMAQTLSHAVTAADSDISALVDNDVNLAGMGTTMCAAMFDGHKLAFVHIGDSRAYRWRDGTLRQLTHDHSFVQQLIDQGHLTEAEARSHPKRSLVLRIVNGTPLSRPDEFADVPKPGDRYLLCSDGLSAYISMSDMLAALRQPDMTDVLDGLLDGSEAAGAPDNVTIVLAEIMPPGDDAAVIKPQLWGAAGTMTPPSDTTSDQEASVVEQMTNWGIDVSQSGFGIPVVVAPRPPSVRPRRRWFRRLLIGLIVVAVLVGAAVGGQAWLRSQYFLGVVDGRVSVFQGAPYRVGPWYLSTIVETSSVNVADLPVYYADQVQQWSIRPSSQVAAEQSVNELEGKANACIAARTNPAQMPTDQECP